MKQQFRHQHSRPKKNSLVVGRNAVIAALNGQNALDRIYLQANVQGEDVDNIKKLAADVGVPIFKVPIQKINNLNVFNHEGCVGQISKVQYQNLQNVISFVVEAGNVPFFVMLDGVTDIRNIGGIARSAYAMGAHALIIPEKGVGALNDDAILTSAGALEHLAVCRVNSLMKAIDELHLNGIKVYAAEMTAKDVLTSIDFTEPCALVMGGEENGIYPALLKICDKSFTIPMPGNFESLNVSVATGVCLYEVVRQRGF
jgi:23S rRNA (guanosine2251-2'-O)-methyltransferase